MLFSTCFTCLDVYVSLWPENVPSRIKRKSNWSHSAVARGHVCPTVITSSEAQWTEHPLSIGGPRCLKWSMAAPSSPPQISGPHPRGQVWVEMTVGCQTYRSGLPQSRDPGHVTRPRQPMVLLSLCPHAVGKHSNSWSQTALETSATSATGESPSPLLLQNITLK